MADILLEPLPTEWEGRSIDPDFRPMVWLSNQYQRKREKKDTLSFAQEAFRRFYREPIPPQLAPEAYETTMAKIMSWRTMDTSGMEGRQRQQYEDLKETFALPKELRHTRTAVTVADHNAAFLQRLRHGDDEEVSAPNG